MTSAAEQVATAVETAAEGIGDTAAAVVETVVAQADAAVEAAEARAEAAEAARDAIADSARRDELYDLIEECEERTQTWHGEVLADISTLREGLSSLTAKLEEVAAMAHTHPPIAIVPSSTPEGSTAPPLETPPEPAAMIIAPANAVPAAIAAAPEVPDRRRKGRFL
jgi:hypothetical protein